MSLIAAVLAALAGQLPVAGPQRQPPLREAVGSTIVMRFHGTTLPGYVAEALRERRAAGVILFHENAPDPPTLRRLTAQVRNAGGPRAIVSLDQEGGDIRIMPWAPPASSQSAVATPQAATQTAQATAAALERAGVNLNLAPVADLSDPGTIMDSRAFPGATHAVADLVAAAVTGYAGSGVVPTLKHFPGLGATDTNTDKESATIDRPEITVKARDLPPFQAGIEAGAPAVMMSHALYPQLDPERIASQSAPIVTGLLRDELGFDGVIMTDSLEAFSVRSRSDIRTAAIRSINAGVDLILTTGAGSHIALQRAFRAEARRSPAFANRLQVAASRVSTLQDRLRRG